MTFMTSHLVISQQLLKNSVVNPSGHGALWEGKLLIAHLTSPSVGINVVNIGLREIQGLPIEVNLSPTRSTHGVLEVLPHNTLLILM